MIKQVFDKVLPPLGRDGAAILGGIFVSMSFGYCLALAATRK